MSILCEWFLIFVSDIEKNTLIRSKAIYWGFPGGLVVKNLPASAGDTGSIPDLGRTPHASGQLSLCAATVKPVL